MISNIKKTYNQFNYSEILLLFFPIAVLLRSSFLNIYMVICGIVFISTYILKKKKLPNLELNLLLIVISIFTIYCFFLAFFSLDKLMSFKGVLSILKFTFFFLFLANIKTNRENFKRTLYFTSFIIMIVSFDTLYQFFNGQNLIGLKVSDPIRLGSFFGNELIVGAFLTLLSIPVVSYFIQNFDRQNYILKTYYLIFLNLNFFAIFLSGERMNFIIIFSVYFVIIMKNFKQRINIIIFVCLFFTIISTIFSSNDGLKLKYKSFYSDVSNFKYSNHGRIFSSAYGIWDENKIFGIGLKNYRVHCDIQKYNNFTKKKNLCSTHPHNIYFEILVETGLIGFLLFLIFLFILLKKFIYHYFRFSENYEAIFFGFSLVVATYFWPLRSSGSFFSTFYGSFFWYNLGITFLMIKNMCFQKIQSNKF